MLSSAFALLTVILMAFRTPECAGDQSRELLARSAATQWECMAMFAEILISITITHHPKGLVGWRPSLLGWRPSLLRLEVIAIRFTDSGGA